MDAPLVLALHGQGMDADALARLLRPLFSLPLRFLLPAAPLQARERLGFSWYDYDGNQERFIAELQRTERLLLDFLAYTEAEHGWRPRSRVLFGFSQGGYCGAYVALRNVDVFGGLIVSGARVKVEVLGDPLERAARAGFQVLLCHGRRDRLVQPEAARSSRAALAAAGVRVTLRTFDAGHAIGPAQIRVVRSWLRRHCGLD
jgi:predicted esterase